MKILTHWLRTYLPPLQVDDAQLAEDLTLRGIAVEGITELHDASSDSDGALFEMDITTNRVDAMNHYGLAREAAAIYDLPLHALDLTLPEASGAGWPVRIEAGDACGRFTAQVVRGVKVGATDSDSEIGRYFGHLGQKGISNAVDISNYVLLGIGQPNHVFDLDKISGAIVVRYARAGEELKLLDGTTRVLAATDLVIADEVRALSLAGVMGGWESMITAETRNILVESAWFDPATIRATSRRHLIHTDASHRYERGADFAAVPVGGAMVTRLLLKNCGGRLDGGMTDVVIAAHEAATVGRAAVRLSIGDTQRRLGATVAAEGVSGGLMRQYLEALGCGITAVDADTFEVRLPSWRLDLARPVDLVEEIARVYGYNGFRNTLPTPAEVVPHPQARARAAVRARLLAMGYTETVSSTFASAADCAGFAAGVTAVALENPLNEEAANLRPTLLPGMVGMLGGNLNRDVVTARLFEAGTVFRAEGDGVGEAVSLALGLTGAVAGKKINKVEDGGFFELKGVVEAVLGLFELPGKVEYTAEDLPGVFEAGRGAVVKLAGKAAGSLGELAAAEAGLRKMRQAVWVAEVDLAALLRLPLRHVTAKEVSRFQAVERDYSFIFPDAVTYGEIAGAIHGLGLAELTALEPVELWRDAVKFPGVYATLLRATFQSCSRTLTQEDLAGASTAIVTALRGLGGEHRAG